MPFEVSVPVVAGVVGALSLLTLWIFKLFPSVNGAGQRLWSWLCTNGPLWPVNRILRAKTLDRLLNPPHPSYDTDSLEERGNAAWELWALLAPVMQRHHKWFMQGYIDAEGKEHPYRHKFVELRIIWCLFWRGESYGKFRARLKESDRLRR